jgi:hypothetical protein
MKVAAIVLVSILFCVAWYPSAAAADTKPRTNHRRVRKVLIDLNNHSESSIIDNSAVARAGDLAEEEDLRKFWTWDLEGSFGSMPTPPFDDEFLDIVQKLIGLPPKTFTVTGQHYAQGFKTENAKEISTEGMRQDCENINLNKKFATVFRSDYFGNDVFGFFDSCVLDGDRTLYAFTVASENQTQLENL